MTHQGHVLGGGCGRNTHVDKLLLLALILRAAGLVLEHDVVVPAALHGKVLLVEEGGAVGNVPLAGLFFLLGALCFLFRSVSTVSGRL